jgi:hypothetical protein
MGYTVGAEIGSYKGEYARLFCEKGLFLNVIDPWIAFPGQGRTQKIQERQDFLYEHTQRILSPYENKKIIRKTSMDALNDFEDESLDFVYIDGDHEFQHVVNDICEWEKKVKKGGMVAGHDYFCTDSKATNIVCQVRPAVDAYVAVKGITKLFLYGRSKPLDKESKNDKYLSWMWIK